MGGAEKSKCRAKDQQDKGKRGREIESNNRGKWNRHKKYVGGEKEIRRTIKRKDKIRYKGVKCRDKEEEKEWKREK